MPRTLNPDLHVSVEDVIAEGDRVVYTLAAGKISAIQVFRLDDGKIVESWANRDDLGLLRLSCTQEELVVLDSLYARLFNKECTRNKGAYRYATISVPRG